MNAEAEAEVAEGMAFATDELSEYVEVQDYAHAQDAIHTPDLVESQSKNDREDSPKLSAVRPDASDA
jgi:hypothetical protein